MHNEISKLIIKSRENRLSHAFLLETNNMKQSLEDIKTLIKEMICPEKVQPECSVECNLCYQVDNDSLPSVHIIYPDGSTIKKQQMLELKEILQTKPIYTDINFYIIINAEKMNNSSANTILKFLEEPSDKIIGFYVTNSVDSIIDTIKSRCQIIKVDYSENINDKLNLTEEEYDAINVILMRFVENLETDSDDCLLLNKEIYNSLKDRNKFEIFFKMLLEIYEKQISVLLNKNVLIQDTGIFDIIKNKNSINRIISKIKLINNYLDNLKYNPNLELFLDCLVIEMSEIYE